MVAAVLAGPAGAQQADDAPGGVVRLLDRLTGATQDLDLSRGQAETVGRLTVLMDDCRYPADNPASDAFAHLTITDASQAQPVFSGWMVASSPALSALDHPRYDVWVLNCDAAAARPKKAPERQDTGEDEPPEDPATDEGDGQ
ncbi:MAG: DUF2155 domain-containing protein [Paracoccaceae bacterium]